MGHDITICYYCSKLGHISSVCNERDSTPHCSRCNGAHERNACEATASTCRDYVDAKKAAVDHEATDLNKCPTAKAFARRLAQRTNYGSQC